MRDAIEEYPDAEQANQRPISHRRLPNSLPDRIFAEQRVITSPWAAHRPALEDRTPFNRRNLCNSILHRRFVEPGVTVAPVARSQGVSPRHLADRNIITARGRLWRALIRLRHEVAHVADADENLLAP
jgi:hypothetical protein